MARDNTLRYRCHTCSWCRKINVQATNGRLPPFGYNTDVRYDMVKGDRSLRWLIRLRHIRAQARILVRIDRMGEGTLVTTRPSGAVSVNSGSMSGRVIASTTRSGNRERSSCPVAATRLVSSGTLDGPSRWRGTY